VTFSSDELEDDEMKQEVVKYKSSDEFYHNGNVKEP